MIVMHLKVMVMFFTIEAKSSMGSSSLL